MLDRSKHTTALESLSVSNGLEQPTIMRLTNEEARIKFDSKWYRLLCLLVLPLVAANEVYRLAMFIIVTIT